MYDLTKTNVLLYDFLNKYMSGTISADISESHLRTLFRRYMGVSIGKFIAQKKMDYARYYLLNSTMSVADIARNSGFVKVYVFSAFFKRNAGVPPLRFRKNIRV